MSKLNIDQKKIKQLFEDKRSDFLIPDYQRPYAWGEDECQTLWKDIFDFAFPDKKPENFNSDEEYFLGPIVTFENNKKLEVIDGQQRLTTLMLLLRVFYKRLEKMEDENSMRTKQNLAQCIWKSDEFGNENKEKLKIDSQVALDEHKNEFLEILKTGDAKDFKSQYAINFRYFEKEVDEFLKEYPNYFAYLPTRILNNCILLPIEADNEKTALRIFSTLNDRGKPLADADIFKAQFYKFYVAKNQKDEFIEKWKNLEILCKEVFSKKDNTSTDEIFNRYMYYQRALKGNKNSTTEGLRDFYEKDSYALLKSDRTFEDLQNLGSFWQAISIQDKNYFDENTLRWLFILNYAPNIMWANITSVYFMKNRDEQNQLDNIKFAKFLEKITAFIFAYSFIYPSVSQLRTPIYSAMVDIINDKEMDFSKVLFEKENLKTFIQNQKFSNKNSITRSMLTWWFLKDSTQKTPELTEQFQIEHIYAKERAKRENFSGNEIEFIGNKVLLERKINIRASDFSFADKEKHYKKSQNNELNSIHKNYSKFGKTEIIERNNNIINDFISFVEKNNLIKTTNLF